jgi:hypothetical protein
MQKITRGGNMSFCNCGSLDCRVNGCAANRKNEAAIDVLMDRTNTRIKTLELQAVGLNEQIKDLTKRFEEFREQMFQVMVNSYNNRKEE